MVGILISECPTTRPKIKPKDSEALYDSLKELYDLRMLCMLYTHISKQQWVLDLSIQIAEYIKSHIDWIGITPGSATAPVTLLDYACGNGLASTVHTCSSKLTDGNSYEFADQDFLDTGPIHDPHPRY